MGGGSAVGEMISEAIAFSFVAPRTAVLVHTRDNPSDDEWRRYLVAMQGLIEVHGNDLVSLVVTDGGGPNAVQRTDMNEALLRGDSFQIAVVTRSKVARGIVTALSWFNAGIKAFKPAQVTDALAYLGLDGREHAEVIATVARLRAALNLEPLAALASG